jgi:putative transposase
VLALVDDAKERGTTFEEACEILDVSPRTVERWKQAGGGEDGRKGPKNAPSNKLSEAEREKVMEVVNSPKYRDLSPSQIVPKLADDGMYIASESTIYRILREEGQSGHRENSRAPSNHRPKEHRADGPNAVWSWDITWLPGEIKGMYYYLYMVMDVWSRRIMGWEIQGRESMDLSSAMIARLCEEHHIDRNRLVLHSDNGNPMKGSTMLATLQNLGVTPSFSRPHVSDDNPFSESLFRTLKYRPEYPTKPFASIGDATQWVDNFVTWYNSEHQHSSIQFVTPDDRHFGREEKILEKRSAVYEKAKRKNPNRWSKETRNWKPVNTVILNPDKSTTKKAA